MTILLVEDDPVITEGLIIALRQEGYEVLHQDTVAGALELVKEAHFEVCLLDISLPDGDGYQVCQAIREKGNTPILFLTAYDDEIHTVLALEKGGDDYISKPFRIRELLARIKAVLRRSGAGESIDGPKSEPGKEKRPEEANERAKEIIHIGRNELNRVSGRLMRDGQEILLSSVEYRLLLIFVRYRGRLLSRQTLMNEMWDVAGDYVNDNTLTVYVRRLRRKLEGEGGEPLIQTVRGIGYRME